MRLIRVSECVCVCVCVGERDYVCVCVCVCVRACVCMCISVLGVERTCLIQVSVWLYPGDMSLIKGDCVLEQIPKLLTLALAYIQDLATEVARHTSRSGSHSYRRLCPSPKSRYNTHCATDTDTDTQPLIRDPDVAGSFLIQVSRGQGGSQAPVTRSTAENRCHVTSESGFLISSPG